jgi:hypothetical protein
VVFAHQDVYFPDGWFQSLARSIDALSSADPGWGVLGVYGVATSGEGAGFLYSTGLRSMVGRSLSMPVEVGSLDEVVMIIRRESGLRFDESLPGFHLYGTDICLEARRRGLRCYVVPGFCIHNSNGIAVLPVAFGQAVWYMRRKWKAQLPLRSPCILITWWSFPLWKHYLLGGLRRIFGGGRVGMRCDDPAALHARLMRERIELESVDGRA